MKKRNNRNSSFSSERKKSGSAVIIWICAATLAIIVALLIGNALNKKAESFKNSAAAVFSYTYDANSVAPIEAHFLNISNHTDESLAAAINALPDNVSAVSLYLRQGDSAVSYSSPVCNAILNTSGNIDLAAAVSLLHNKNIYVSVCFDCNSFNISDVTARTAAIAFEAALISEAAKALVDDIIVTGSPSTDLGVSYVAMLFSEIRKLSPTAILGVSMSFEALKSESGADALKKYSGFADFCLIDVSNEQSNGKDVTTLGNSLLHVFKVYPVRLLIGVTGEADFANQVEALNALGITNVQAYRQRSSSAVG